jgi:hypothetical protein
VWKPNLAGLVRTRWKIASHRFARCVGEGLSYAHKIKVLNFNKLGLHDEQVASLANALRNHPSLRTLKLAGNNCGSQGLTAIAGLLESTALVDLDLSYQGGIEPLDLTILAASLVNSASLRKLALTSNNLDDRSIASLADAALWQSSIQELDLRSNNISDEGIHFLAVSLAQSVTMKRLSLHSNPFGEEGGMALLSALHSNTVFEFISLPGRLECGKQIFHLLQLNKGGRRLLRAQNVPRALWPLALERVNRLLFWSPGKLNTACQVNVIYSLLQGPALLERCR